MFLLCRIAVLHNILTICCKKEGLIVLSISACMCTVRCEITYSCIHVSSLKAWRGTFFWVNLQVLEIVSCWHIVAVCLFSKILVYLLWDKIIEFFRTSIYLCIWFGIKNSALLLVFCSGAFLDDCRVGFQFLISSVLEKLPLLFYVHYSSLYHTKLFFSFQKKIYFLLKSIFCILILCHH